MKSRKKIAVFTGSRAEYGLLYPILNRLRSDGETDLRLLVSGTHFSKGHGTTASEISRDGFSPDLEIPLDMRGDSEVDIARATAHILERMAIYFTAHRADILVLLGDRFEVLAAAQAALFARIPIAHLHGGESTEGLIDEAIRHAVTKMAHLHLVSAESYRARVIQMGEQPERVKVMGAACIDNIRDFNPVSERQFRMDTGLAQEKNFFLVTHHPLTLSRGAAAAEIVEILTALDAFPEYQLLFTGVNADMENGAIRRAVETYKSRQPERVICVESLGRTRYYNALTYASAVIGNSSSGLLEAPFFGTPTVNIGQRQSGRLSCPSVINVPSQADDIVQAIRKVLTEDFIAVAQQKQSPYGTLASSPAEIAHGAITQFLGTGDITKHFYTCAIRS
jgi:UDP-hydrolysing UDP-N-acetyl-D-glucosamine 2-epimerase